MAPERVLVLDLGGVLIHWNAKNLMALPEETFWKAIGSDFWKALERGELNEQEAISRIAAHLKVSVNSVNAALKQCRPSMSLDAKLMEALKTFKAKTGIRVYAMTNVTVKDYAGMRLVMPDVDLFDGIFTSFELGTRKPEPASYWSVTESIGVKPKDVVFVDDTVDNIKAASFHGWRSLHFTGSDTLMDNLDFIFLGAIAQGKAFLRANARNLYTQVEAGINHPYGLQFWDSFAQSLIMSTTDDVSILHLRPDGEYTAPETDDDIYETTRVAKQLNYFINDPVGTTKEFPKDVDTTSYSLLAFRPTEGVKEVLDSMIANRNDAGLIQTYWDPTRPRIDICVLTNVVRAFYAYGRGSEVKNELDFLTTSLELNDIKGGTRHYIHAETFYFFQSQLIAENPNAPEVQALRKHLNKALLPRMGVTDNRVDSLCVTMRVLAGQVLGLDIAKDMMALKKFQSKDGGWPLGWVCHYGRTKERIGSRGVVTAFSVKALEDDIFYH